MSELVDHLDSAGNLIGVVTRREMRERRLPHRSVYLLVFNSRGELFIHLRTATKDYCPSHWDVTIGGVVAAGESFDEAARREGSEELGVAVEPRPLFPTRYVDAELDVFGMVYCAEHDGPFDLQAEEVVRGEFVSLTDLTARIERERFCPDGLAALAKFRAAV